MPETRCPVCRQTIVQPPLTVAELEAIARLEAERAA